jgi:symplekin
MAEDGLSLHDQLRNLDQARLLVLKDPVYWPQIFRGILPVVAIPTIELRRWGSRFLAETFSSPVLNPEVKQELAKESLDTLLILVMEKDVEVAKNIAQCCASVYPFIFKLMYVHYRRHALSCLENPQPRRETFAQILRMRW